ncbi:MAG: metal ABC transporter permease [Chloroflexia bacterium]|nr:metal ABC transporter permease [Chloroflexia bacterium]
MSIALVIMITGALVGASCAIVGTFLVLRRMSMMGDAISHSVLLGIVAVFFFTGSRSPILAVLGAGAVGLLTVSLVELIYRTGRVKEDAAIGLVFPALFSIGVILVSRFPSAVHIDVDHVLYGEITFVAFDRLTLFGVDAGYRSFWLLGAMTIVNALFVLLFFKELKLATFDRGFAAALGFAPTVIHYALMALVSATTVVAFDSVGAILVVAMLIVPAAAAYLLTDRLLVMLGLAVAIGSGSAIGGYWLARWIDGSIAAAMAVVAGVVFVACFLFAPRHGLVARYVQLFTVRRAFARSLLLSHLRLHPGGVSMETIGERFLWSRRMTSNVVTAAVQDGLVTDSPARRLTLTKLGSVQAQQVPGH